MAGDSDNVVLFADASANWRVGGLRQIERLIFALEELAARDPIAAPTQIDLVWSSQVPVAARRLPRRHYAAPLALREWTGADFAAAARSPSRCLTTHLLVVRSGLPEVLSRLRPTADVQSAQAELARVADEIEASVSAPTARVLAGFGATLEGETWLMRSLGKSQDGFVSRYLNRRISIQISRALLVLRTRPVHATLLGLIIGLAGCVSLVRGGYYPILQGMILIYGFSVLDGCDGELARVKYLDSAAGRRLDLIADVMVSLLFLVTLGLGLAQTATGGWWRTFYFSEGFAAAGATVLGEGLLAFIARGPAAPARKENGALYARHAQMLGRSGVFALFGPRLVQAVVQLTKRDVSILFFVLLAALDQAAWILHLSLGVALLSSTVSLLALRRRPAAVAA